MFGYVRPLRDELKVRDFDRFKAAYCGLCRAIGERYGLIPRMFLNYDFTFLAIVLSVGETEHETSCARCIASPIRKKRGCIRSPAFNLAADESVILTYHKLLDSAEDEGFLRGIPARILSFLLYPSYRKAKRNRPEFEQRTKQCLLELHDLESARSNSLDKTADTFARILSAAAQELQIPEQSRPVEQLLYHIGRWIYLADAYHDRIKDAKNGVYNPVLSRFSSGPWLSDADQETLRITMTHSLNLAVSAFGLMPAGYWSDIIANILYFGLPMASRLILADQWEAGKKVRNQI